MAEYDFSIGQSDTGVRWAVPVFDSNGAPVDPTGATGVVLHFRIDDDSAEALTLTGAVVAQTAGPAFVARTFQAADLAVPGVYLAQWLITLLSGERLTYPSDRKMRVLVEDQA